MTTEAEESYIVFTYFLGFRMYLSIMGGYSRDTYNYIWDREVRSSRDFETKADAKAHGEIAITQNKQANGVYVVKKLTHQNGMVELK